MKEVIPNSISSVLIMATTDIRNQILMFSTLSFLGLGLCAANAGVGYDGLGWS